ncbi:HpcH/HpaI aldolase family protein [Spongiibacter marinus]|uniref:HpcH/HpaI aldolase family protein n=1 Tax=Spongiibacter marinus TaxID=354246 RepID=UPI000488F4DE|nr:aldolase/citrate lyase family protein [Spongiibacter marinus]
MNQDILFKFKKKLGEEPCLGLFSKTLDSDFVAAVGYGGMDFIILDMEHGPVPLPTIHHHTRAAIMAGLVPVVRVKGVDSHAIGSALDAGALGVQVPNIATAEQAAVAVKAAKYHPNGMRGVCCYVKAADFGEQPKQDYLRKANNTLLILQVEGVEGIENLDAILDVDGFDILFIGPYDLSQSVGKPGQVDSPEVLDLMRRISSKAKAKGVLLGSFSDSLHRNASLKEEGFSYIAYSVDVNIFMSKIKEIVSNK